MRVAGRSFQWVGFESAPFDFSSPKRPPIVIRCFLARGRRSKVWRLVVDVCRRPAAVDKSAEDHAPDRHHPQHGRAGMRRGNGGGYEGKNRHHEQLSERRRRAHGGLVLPGSLHRADGNKTAAGQSGDYGRESHREGVGGEIRGERIPEREGDGQDKIIASAPEDGRTKVAAELGKDLRKMEGGRQDGKTVEQKDRRMKM